MRLVLDEVRAGDLSPGDRILWEGHGRTITEILDLRLGGNWPPSDATRLDVVLENIPSGRHPDMPEPRPTRLMLRPTDLVLALRREPGLLIIPSEAS